MSASDAIYNQAPASSQSETPVSKPATPPQTREAGFVYQVDKHHQLNIQGTDNFMQSVFFIDYIKQ